MQRNHVVDMQPARAAGMSLFAANDPVVRAQRGGDRDAQRYTLVRHETDSVFGSGRPGAGVQFKSDPSRRLISDEFVWFEGDDRVAKREAFIADLVGGAA